MTKFFTITEYIKDIIQVSSHEDVDRLIISKERIKDEFNKILLSDNATMGIRTLCDIGAMKYI